MLLEKIIIILRNIEKQKVVDSMAEKAGHPVLRLPPYHRMLNPTELAWNQLKYHVHHLIVYTSKLSKVADLIRKVCKEYISAENSGYREGKVSYYGPYT